ncbi:N-acetylgalactosamine kinase-like [Centruroides sculpturatus]|uniref:N-acetylgalactosamine kinase-like n=1 Tax=Centruroides sculpturatus TaxID=218467 RepID=UPI000C6D6C96|nr:N-acetylgalactosamine kinase-like [Centruroides sculpturatus]XP_023240086.1 N-acetylgalactosamine kinase-like [Centruroides sculpturatus]XP_023240087.1 N-acetylgalactosamine kinase-like [Centruroides sculpturatus]
MEIIPVLSLSENSEKWEAFSSLRKHFKQKFGCQPSFYVRVPGRVNIIGEHIDYCGYSVLPMAIEQDIVVAVVANKNNRLNLTNVDQDFYSDFSTATDALKIDRSTLEWHNYFLCGFQGIIEEYSLKLPLGMDVALQGTVPPSSGLSSSSALVCCAALATAYINSISISKLEIASLCAKSERYIGTQGGGMDQAIAFLAEKGSAKLIEFNPLRATDVHLPAEAAFVIANSCVEMNKAATSHYNTRVVECHLAAQIIAKDNNLEWNTFKKLGDVQKALGVSLEKMPELVDSSLHEQCYTRKELYEIFHYSPQEFERIFLTDNTIHLQEFKLYQRAMHVYKEAHRVICFKTIAEKRSNVLTDLGELMNESHASCRDMYECSHPQLDKLVKISIGAGALGSRLTGAGWGGCSVSLVPKSKINQYIEEVKEKFYSNLNKGNLENVIFATQPGGGAVIYKV